METHVFSDSIDTVDTAILIKESSFNIDAVNGFYLEPLTKFNISKERFCMISLYYDEIKNDIKAKDGKAYITHVLTKLSETNIRTLFVADSKYFKMLTKKQKVTNCRGYVFDCAIKGFEDFKIILSVNFNAINYNENQKKDLDLSIITLAEHLGNTFSTKLGSNIIDFEEYPNTVEEISKWLSRLRSKPFLTCDIEAFSLRFEKAGIGTIGFAWSSTEGIAFDVSHTRTEDIDTVKNLIRNFLENYQGDLVFHNLLYDDKVLIYELFMDDDTDWAGMRRGLEVAARHEDSMVVAYLATNNAIENKLGLKELAYEYLGDWGEDVEDITQIPLPNLLTYNLKDCLATSYVWEKYYPRMVSDNQLNYYRTIGKPSLKISLKMMLTGLPMDMDKVYEAEKKIKTINNKHSFRLIHNPSVKKATFLLNKREWKKKNEALKKKFKPLSEFNRPFNPNSDSQLQTLLYEVLKLPVLDTTKNGAPSTSSKVIKRLYDHPDAQPYLNILDDIIGISETSIILSTFISAFKKYAFTRSSSYEEFNESNWLNGNLKTTGTKSGRLSSSDP